MAMEVDALEYIADGDIIIALKVALSRSSQLLSSSNFLAFSSSSSSSSIGLYKSLILHRVSANSNGGGKNAVMVLVSNEAKQTRRRKTGVAVAVVEEGREEVEGCRQQDRQIGDIGRPKDVKTRD